MQLRQVGRSGLEVSLLGLGTLTWGRDTDEYEAHDLFQTFVSAGGNLLDTSDAYGEGAAESLLGEVIQSQPRESYVIATKASRPDGSRTNLRESLARSLDRLGIDYVDLWQIQAPRTPITMADIALALDHALQSGTANYVGLSNFPAWQVALVKAEMQKPELLVAGQYEYSLLAREVEADVLPALQYLGMSLLAWSPLGRGVLTGKYRRSVPADSRAASPHLGGFTRARMGETSKPIVEAVAAAATGLGATPAETALAWLLAKSGVASAIVGARTGGQLRAALNSLELELPAPIATALDDVSEQPPLYPTSGSHR